MVTVLHNQSLFDISIQVYGSVAYVFDLALANGLSITSDLAPGQQIDVPELEVESTSIRDYYAANGIKPATAIIEENLPTEGNCNYCKLFE
jgi:LysM repeat protein